MNNMLKVWIVSGILVGLVMGAFGIVYYVDYWLMVLLVGGVSGIVFGFCLGVIANVLTRSGQSGCLCAFLLMLAGFILGPVLFFAVDQLPHGQWWQLASPPEKAVRFVGQSAFNFWGGSIYVETESGNYYSHTCDSENPCFWAEEEAPPGESEENFWSCQPGNFRSVATPIVWFGTVVDTFEVQMCGADYTDQINFVLLDDGAIWVWNNFSSMFDLWLYPIWSIVGSIAGLAGYIAYKVGSKKQTKVL